MHHKIRLFIVQDNDCENPMDFEGTWRMVHFGRDYRVSHDDDGEYHTIGFKAKLRAGTAFALRGTDGHLRTTNEEDRLAGYLICDDKNNMSAAKNYGERKRDAEGTLAQYNAWCNGECYGYYFDPTIVDGDTEIEMNDSCFGFIVTAKDDKEYFIGDNIQPTIDGYITKLPTDIEHTFEIVIGGDAAELIDAGNLTTEVKQLA